MRNIGKLLAITLLLISSLIAKEPENIIVGAGIGEGYNTMDIRHSQFARHPIEGTGNNGGIVGQPVMTPRTNVSSSSWALAWEFLAGYKHFINDYIGFRYYANVGIQHYKPTSLLGQGKKEKIGLIDYTLNMDLLFDFYASDSFAFGVFGGVGFGGTSFDKNALNQYKATYNNTEEIPIGASDITQHFFNANASVGVRVVIFQSIGLSSGARNCDIYSQGRRACSTPSKNIGHNFEVVAKFNLLEYNATKYDIMINANANAGQQYVSRPGYRIKNPYRFTFRYIVEF